MVGLGIYRSIMLQRWEIENFPIRLPHMNLQTLSVIEN